MNILVLKWFSKQTSSRTTANFIKFSYAWKLIISKWDISFLHFLTKIGVTLLFLSVKVTKNECCFKNAWYYCFPWIVFISNYNKNHKRIMSLKKFLLQFWSSCFKLLLIFDCNFNEVTAEFVWIFFQFS